MPTYIGSGALVQAASGNVSPPVHASTIAGDLLVCVVYSGDNAAHSVAGYTQVPSANVTAGTTSRLSTWTKTAVGGDTAPTVTHTAGDQIEARVHTLRGASGVGSFSSNTGTPAAGVAVSSITSTDMTPQNAGSMILSIAGLSNNDTSSAFNFNPTGGASPAFTERTDDAGNGLGSRQTGMMMDTGTPSVTTAIGSRTTAMTATVTPAPATGSITWISFMLEILPSSGAALDFDSLIYFDDMPAADFGPDPFHETAFDNILSVGQTLSLQIDDTLTLADAIAFGLGLGLSDSVTLADAIAKDMGLGLSDSVTTADALGKDMGLVINEAILTIADAIANSLSIQISDTVAIADALTASIGHNLSIDDVLSLADAISSDSGKGASIDDLLTIADAISFDQGKVIADTVALADALAFDVTIQINDTVTVTDLISPHLGGVVAAVRGRLILLNRFGIY